jgi:hypothetical protein
MLKSPAWGNAMMRGREFVAPRLHKLVRNKPKTVETMQVSRQKEAAKRQADNETADIDSTIKGVVVSMRLAVPKRTDTRQSIYLHCATYPSDINISVSATEGLDLGLIGGLSKSW